MIISHKLLAIFLSVAATTHVPAKLLEATCYTESRFKVHAIHKDDGGEDSVGICQIKYSTAKWLGYKGSKYRIFDPNINIYYAAKYLRYQLNRYKTPARALTAYNRGNARRFTTSIYAKKVLQNEKLINRLVVTNKY